MKFILRRIYNLRQWFGTLGVRDIPRPQRYVVVPLFFLIIPFYFLYKLVRRLFSLRPYFRAGRLLWSNLDSRQRLMLVKKGYFFVTGSKTRSTYLIHLNGQVESYVQPSPGRGHLWTVYCSHPEKDNLPGPDIAYAQKLLIEMDDNRWRIQHANAEWWRLRAENGKWGP